MLLEPGRLLGAYEVLEPLGRGGMGEVYRARHTRLGMLAAIKVVSARLESDPAAAERLNREARLASSLNHPAIVTIHDIGETDGRPFIVMELIEGEPLSARLAAGPMTAHDALELACQVADGLEAAHGAGVVHRDLKPRNIMVTSDGHRAKIVDFGLSKAAPVAAEPDDPTQRLPDDFTAPHTVLGSVGYMAPEQVAGRKATFQTDQFALGVVLYKMLTGRRAFRRDTDWQTIAAIAGEDPTPLAEVRPSLPPQLVTIVERCLAKRPIDRYGSTRDLAHDLASVRDRLTSGPQPVPAPPQPTPSPPDPGSAPPTPVRRWRRAVAAILVLAGAGVVYAFYAGALRDGAGGSSQVTFQQVAVLPFTCADPNDRVFCDGLVETLTSGLAGLSAFEKTLRVVSQAVALRDMPPEKASPETARSTLGATVAITGGMQRRASGIRVIVTAIDTEDSTPNLWTRLLGWWRSRSQTIDIGPGQESTLQRALVTGVADLLHVDLGPEARAAIDAGGTTVPAAFQAYVRGRGYLHGGRQNADRAVEVLNTAVHEDPRYALAHAALCDAYWLQGEAGLARESCTTALFIRDRLVSVRLRLIEIARVEDDKRDEVIALAKDVVSMAPLSSDAHHALGAAYEADKQWANAEAAYAEALRLLPEDPQVYSDLCRFYVYAGGHQPTKDDSGRYYEKGKDACEHARILTPDSTRVLNNLGATFYSRETYDFGKVAYQHSMDVRPTATASAMLGVYDYRRGEYDKAADHYENAVTVLSSSLTDPITTYHGLGAALWAAGAEEAKWRPAYEEVARRILAADETDKTRVTELTSPKMLGQFADSCAMLGRTDDARLALDALEHLTVDDNGVMFLVASAHERVDDRPGAFRWLTRAVASGYPCDQVNKSPFLNELRKDQRYASVGCR